MYGPLLNNLKKLKKETFFLYLRIYFTRKKFAESMNTQIPSQYTLTEFAESTPRYSTLQFVKHGAQLELFEGRRNLVTRVLYYWIMSLPPG